MQKVSTHKYYMLFSSTLQAQWQPFADHSLCTNALKSSLSLWKWTATCFRNIKTQHTPGVINLKHTEHSDILVFEKDLVLVFI